MFASEVIRGVTCWGSEELRLMLPAAGRSRAMAFESVEVCRDMPGAHDHGLAVGREASEVPIGGDLNANVLFLVVQILAGRICEEDARVDRGGVHQELMDHAEIYRIRGR